MIEKNRFLTLIFKRSKSAILFGLQNFDRHYLENGTREMMFIEVKEEVIYGLSNGIKNFDPR